MRKILISLILATALLGCDSGTGDTLAKPADEARLATSTEKPAAAADPGHGEPGHAAHGDRSAPKNPEDMSEEELDQAKQEARKAIVDFRAAFAKKPKADLEVFSWDGTKGSSTPLVTVIEYADFDCPHCKLAAYFTKDLAHRYGDRVQFVFKNYPLGKVCNEAMQRDLHPNACHAAVSVICAGRRGKFWEMHDGVFEKQGDLGKRNLKKVAKDIGLEADDFAECLESEGPMNDVRTQVRQARSLGLDGTPAFFVDGRHVESPHPLLIEAAIRTGLKKAGETMLPEDPDQLFGD